jgi:4'-phosphopantetheinyl transferase
MCAICSSGANLGCDLEIIEPHSDAFVADYFTAYEQALVQQATTGRERFALVALIWSAKESALKAIHGGLRLDTRCMEVRVTGTPLNSSQKPHQTTSRPSDSAAWNSLQVFHIKKFVLFGWWREADQMTAQ